MRLRGAAVMTDSFTAATLMRLATGYLARYAASTHRLRQVLERRIRRWHVRQGLPMPEDAHATIDEVVLRLTRSGLVDDDAFAAGRARSLARKGLPERRIRRALEAVGLDARSEGVDAALDGDDASQAQRYASRKRLGPHRHRDRALHRDKDVRSMIRAGFSPRIAMAAIDAEPETDP